MDDRFPLSKYKRLTPDTDIDEYMTIYVFWKRPLHQQFYVNFQKHAFKFVRFWIITVRVIIFVNSKLVQDTLAKTVRFVNQLRVNKKLKNSRRKNNNM